MANKRRTVTRKSRVRSRRTRSRRSIKSKNSHTSGPPEKSLTELQNIAKRMGIPFGGLSKLKLIRKIKRYGHNIEL
jgi:hypothetical protein